ncbi:MAG TPA: exosortase A [Candidatus Binatia bacterium]|nr:exosortase A [Candidatus Binatia bacterium]
MDSLRAKSGGLAPSLDLPRPRRWPLAAALFALGLAAMAAAYPATLGSFYEVWRGSDTFTHCFFVIPITAWLVWRRRADLRALAPEPFWPGLLLIAGAGALWLVAHVAGVLFYEQLAFALMIPALVITLFGLRVTRTLTFPLAFFFFVVPFGEALHPALMSFTARATVFGLRLTGVPVAVEGMYLTTPTGNWQVVEACSGLRFLISMFTLGCLFAYLHFQRARNRILFGSLALVAPILANGLRAYVMVLTGYLSRREIGAGFDHFAIGWTVFAIAMAIFFFLGSRWRETPVPVDDAAAPRPATARSPRRLAVTAAAAVALALAPAAYAAWIRPPVESAPVALHAPAPAGGWTPLRIPPSAWAPEFKGTDAAVRAVFEKNGSLVDCYIGFYRNQSQGRELIHYANVIAPRGESVWHVVTQRDTTIAAEGDAVPVHETLMRSPGLRYGVWHWYWLPDEFTGSATRAKLLQARSRLLRRPDHAAVVILSAPYVDNPARARARLEDFTRSMLPSIHRSLREADASH